MKLFFLNDMSKYLICMEEKQFEILYTDVEKISPG